LAFSGKQISFTYQALTCQTQHLTQFVDLLKQVNIQPLSITNNSLCLGNYFGTNNGMDKLVIDVKTSQTIINLYDKEGVIKKMVTFNEGVNAIIRELKSFMNFTTEEKLTEIINASKNLQEVNDQICLVNIHSEEFLVVKEINYKCFNECVKLCVYRFFKKIETFIENICQSEHAKINKVYMVCTDSAINVFNDNCPSMLCGQYEIGMLKCHIIGLEDVNIISAISALNYVYNEQEESGKYVYSVDEYVSEEASEIQARQSL
jgi:hypothetical protein